MGKKYAFTEQEIYEDFHRFVKKPLENILGGEVVFTKMTSKIGEMLARVSDIDAFLIRPERKMNGINLSILYGKNLRVFAIRSLSEAGVKADYEKFHLIREMGGFTPQFHVQVYLDEERTHLRGMAVVKTEDIYDRLIERERLGEMTDSCQLSGPRKCHIVEWDAFGTRYCWYQEVKTENSLRGENENPHE